MNSIKRIENLEKLDRKIGNQIGQIQTLECFNCFCESFLLHNTMSVDGLKASLHSLLHPIPMNFHKSFLIKCVSPVKHSKKHENKSVHLWKKLDIFRPAFYLFSKIALSQVYFVEWMRRNSIRQLNLIEFIKRFDYIQFEWVSFWLIWRDVSGTPHYSNQWKHTSPFSQLVNIFQKWSRLELF